MRANKWLATSLIVVIIVSISGTGAPAALAQDPGDWNKAICDGAEGVVFRDVNGTTSDLPTQEGCAGDKDLGWLIVEPWERTAGEAADIMNPDRACFSESWNLAGDSGSVVSAATRMNWNNGSVWRVPNSTASNPLVVNCADVSSNALLGLNPGEGQVELRQIKGTILRAEELLSAAGETMSSYATKYPDHPITQLFLLVELLKLGAE